MSIHSREQALSILGIANGSDDKKNQGSIPRTIKEYILITSLMIKLYISILLWRPMISSQMDRMRYIRPEVHTRLSYKAGSSDINIDYNGMIDAGRNGDPNGDIDYDRSAEPRILEFGRSKTKLVRKKAREERERYERNNGNGREKDYKR